MNRKRLNVLSFLGLVAAFSVGGLVSCGGGDTPVTPVTPTGDPIEASSYFEAYLTKEINGETELLTTSKQSLVECGYTGVVAHAYQAPKNSTISWEVYDANEQKTNAVQIDSEGNVTLPSVSAKTDYTVYCVATGKDSEGNTKSYRVSFALSVVPNGSIATGEQELTGLTNDELESTFSGAEALALETGLAGMNFWSYGGYQQIASRVVNTRSTDGKWSGSSYVPGYGFGIGAYGYLSSDNPQETKAEWKRYYHSENSAQTNNLNYWNSNGTGISDYWSIFNAPLFEQLLNSNDSAEYTAAMARTAEPIPLDDDGNELTGEAANGLHTKWKVKVNTDTIKYRNLGTKNGSAYDGQSVALEDYLTPYILQYTNWVGCANVSQLLGTFVGDDDYYASTKDTPTSGKVTVDDFLAAFPGIKLDKADNALIFEFQNACTSDFAAYRLNKQGFMPLSFIQDTLGNGNLKTGKEKYGTKDTTDGSEVEDNVLSTGPYVLEKCDENRIVYKRNADWWVKQDSAGRDVYKLEGYVYTLNTALAQDSDQTLAWRQYTEGYVDSGTIPSSKLDELKEDPLTIHIEDTGSKNGVSFNCLNAVDYDYLFGGDVFDAHAAAGGGVWGDSELGSAGNSAYRTAFFEDDWEVKPIMGNHNFQKGLNCGYDRDTFAANYGRKGYSDYFGNVNKMTPKASESYNDTDAHRDAVTKVYGSTGVPTNSNTKGIEYFREAIYEELEAGHYELGTASNPTTITINVNWQSQVWVNYQGTSIFNAISNTFETAVLSNSEWCENGKPLIKLVFEQTYEGSGSSDYVNAYAKVALGQYDIAQASISGGEYEVFQETGLWESYNRSYGLTVHHALVTNIPSSYITYNGKYYSLDGIFYGYDEGVTLDDYGRIDYSSLNPVA